MDIDRRPCPPVNDGRPPISGRIHFTNNYQKLAYKAKVALDHYNSNQQQEEDQFELVDPLYLQYVHDFTYTDFYHLSFIARSAKDSSFLKYFFAEINVRDVVKICTPVEPGSPFFPLGCKTCHADGVVYHPLGNCTMFGRADTSLRRPALGPCEEAAKKFLLESYTFENHVQELNTEKDKKLRREVDIYANRALDMYNSRHEHGYKLVEHIACVRFGWDVPSFTYFADRWAHLFFEAMNTDPTCTDSSPKLFFAEICLNMYEVTKCITLPPADSGSSFSGTESSCEVCREHCNMFHPRDLGFAGHNGAAFGDALVNGRSWGRKVVLRPNVDASINDARDKFREMAI